MIVGKSIRNNGLLFGKGEGRIISCKGVLYSECNDLEQVTGVDSKNAGYYQGELSFTSASHTLRLIVHPAKEVICLGIGVFPGSLFCSILTGPNDSVEGAFIYLLEDNDGFIKFVDINILTFDPHFFQSSWDIRNRVHGLEDGASITPEEI